LPARHPHLHPDQIDRPCRLDDRATRTIVAVANGLLDRFRMISPCRAALITLFREWYASPRDLPGTSSRSFNSCLKTISLQPAGSPRSGGPPDRSFRTPHARTRYLASNFDFTVEISLDS
jgi:hypothetical protein